MASRTSLSHSPQLHRINSQNSELSSPNQNSSKRLSIQLSIQTYINIADQLTVVRIYDKYLKFLEYGKGKKDSYKGDLKQGIKVGFGTYTFKNQDQYIGYWEEDKMYGMGIYLFYNGSNQQQYIYIGEFMEGKFHGIGKLIYLKNKNDINGTVIYQGLWHKGGKNGFGIYFYGPDTTYYYEGHWQNDMKNGEGRLIFKQGEYSGCWSNDKMHGQGKLRIQRPQRTLIYEGQWFYNDLHQGQITYLNSNLAKQGAYKGKIKKGKKHGEGTFEFNNVSMKGSFEDDYFTGKGTLSTHNYQVEGDFINPKTLFKGVINYSNGDIFQGILDLASGTIRRLQGEYKFLNGDSSKGTFDDKGSGNLTGIFQYIWNTGEAKRFGE